MDDLFGNTFLDPNPASLSKDPTFNAIIGPFVRFRGMVGNIYSTSVLIIAKESPKVFVNDTAYTPSILDVFKSYNFYCFYIDVNLCNNAQMITYKMVTNSASQEFNFHVPSATENCKFSFYSCAGISKGVDSVANGGYCPLWQDLIQEHLESPMHLLVGGGDQLYNDVVFDIPSLQEWNKSKTRQARTTYNASETILNEINNFYFQHYCQQFMRDHIRTALSSIPSINTWDDHDIFNGHGSYPADLENCPIFTAVFASAKRFYYLFQLHSKMNDNNGFVSNSTFLSTIGPNQAILCLDTRTDRSLTQILSPESYDLIFQQLKALPLSVKHLIIVLGVPILFPPIKKSEFILNAVSKINKQSNYAFDRILKPFGEPDLLSDFVDQWNAAEHTKEKSEFLSKCQALANDHMIRITFLSGDSHCCGSAQTYSKADQAVTRPHDDIFVRHKNHKISPVYDHRHMNQIISSAIANAPPPAIAMIMLHLTPNHSQNGEYCEAMTGIFKKDVPVVSRDRNGYISEKHKDRKPKYKWMMARRNYCTFTYNADDELHVEYRIEKEINYLKIGAAKDITKFRVCQGYTIAIPPLLKPE